MGSFKKQAEPFGTRFYTGTVTKVDLKSTPFVITLSGGRQIKRKSPIIATGAAAKWIGLPNEKRLMGGGVSGCATCDGFFFKNKEIAVVGGGDTASEEATFLTRFAKKVTVIHRRDKFRASKAMQEKALKNPKISILWNSTVEDILGTEKVSGVKVKNVLTQQTQEILFVAIGHELS